MCSGPVGWCKHINIDNTKETVVLHPSSLRDSTGSQSALFLLVREIQEDRNNMENLCDLLSKISIVEEAILSDEASSTNESTQIQVATIRSTKALQKKEVQFYQIKHLPIQKFIPGVTEYCFKQARLHILKYGGGAPVPVQRSPRMRLDECQLDQFLSFITSPHVVQDLPFGQRYLHLANGQVLARPNVIRSMIPQRIVMQYTQFCKEDGTKPLSPSTALRILSVCTATVQRSLQADGAKAFDDLAGLLTKLKNHGCDQVLINSCEAALKAGKQYIKTDYKVHVSEASNVPDHCCVHALSDQKQPLFSSKCNHLHDHSCSSCKQLNSTLASIKSFVKNSAEKLPDDERDNVIFTCQQSIAAIEAWKQHQ
ncbi:Hypothetical predicted protein [Paramuricea clavata]|uniref:Uncharacterized protein n=1 Tax=Paramuricea clavata TaxID=317549 RepID=A0A7D9HZA5_PARCT|nr:Hypothetical predicted protein [Paramuricea clavata]